MRYWLFISFLCAYVTASSQVFWSPVWMKESVRMTGLTGTGNYLYINAAGQLSKVAGVGAAGVTGLSNQQILYGKSDGTIDQEAAFTYDESINFLNMTNGVIFIDGTGLNDLTISESGFSVQEFAAGVQRGGELTPNYLRFDLDGFETYIYRTSGGSDYNWYLPNAQGGANTFLKNDGSGNLSWATAGSGTVTSIATTSPITGGTITTTGTIGINDADDDGTTKGAATFNNTNFDATSGVVTIANDGVTLGTNTTGNYVASVSTTSPLSGGAAGSEGATLTLTIADADANGSTKGAASFSANDFDASSGNISIDYTNAQKASASVPGFVSTAAQDIAGVKTFQSNIELEGATANGFETAITATDPTADNTVTVQDVTGTIPMAVGTPVSLTGQTAAIAATTAYTAPVDGYYAVYYNATVTTAATSSCVLGPLQVRYTEATDNVVKTFPTSSVNFITQTNRNNTDAAIGGMFMVHAKAGTAIQYIMGYTSSGITAMAYNLEITIIKIR